MSIAGSIRMAKAHVEVGGDLSPLNRVLAAASQRMTAWGTSLMGIGQSMMQTGILMSAALVPAVLQFADYDQALANLRAAADPTAEDFARIQVQIEEMSKATGISGTEVAAMYGELIKAGAPVSAVLNGMGEAALQFARVSGLEMADTARILWGTMQVFSREGLSATQVMNMMASADGASATSLRELSEAFRVAGPVMADYGQTMESVSVMLAILGNNLAEGAYAGTGLRIVFSRLAQGNSEVVAALNEMGLGTAGLRDSTGQLLPAIEIIDRLQGALGRFGTEDQQRLANMIGGERGATQLATLLREGADGFREMQERMNSSLPVGERFRIMTDTLWGNMRRVWVHIQYVAIAIGRALQPAISSTGAVLMPLLTSFQRFIEQNEDMVQLFLFDAVKAIAFGAALYALGIALKVVAFGFSGLSMILTALKFVWTVLSTVISVLYSAALFVASIATTGYTAVAAVCAFVMAILTAETLAAALAFVALATLGLAAVVAVFLLGAAIAGLLTADFSGLLRGLEGIGRTFSQVWGGMQDAFAAGDLEGAFNIAWLGIQLIFAQVVNVIKDIWFELIRDMGNTWGNVTLAIALAMVTMGSVVSAIFYSIRDTMANVFMSVVGYIADAINAIIDLVPDVIAQEIGLTRVANPDSPEARAEREEEQRRDRERREAATEAERQRLRTVHGNEEQTRNERLTAERQRAHREETRIQADIDGTLAEAEFWRGWYEMTDGMADAMRRPRPDGDAGDIANMSSFGSFSGGAIRGFGGGLNTAERTARAVELANQLAREQNEIARENLRLVNELLERDPNMRAD